MRFQNDRNPSFVSLAAATGAIVTLGALCVPIVRFLAFRGRASARAATKPAAVATRPVAAAALAPEPLALAPAAQGRKGAKSSDWRKANPMEPARTKAAPGTRATKSATKKDSGDAGKKRTPKAHDEARAAKSAKSGKATKPTKTGKKRKADKKQAKEKKRGPKQSRSAD
jgi:hypothetical protein